MTKLHELGAEFESLNTMVEAGEFTLQDIEDQLESSMAEFNDKGKAVAYVIENLKSDEAQLKVMIDKLTARQKSYKNNQASLKRYLADNMLRSGINQIKTPDITISLRKPTKKLVVDCDPFELPMEYQVTSITADKKALKDALKEKDIDGVRLEDGDYSVSIRV